MGKLLLVQLKLKEYTDILLFFQLESSEILFFYYRTHFIV